MLKAYEARRLRLDDGAVGDARGRTCEQWIRDGARPADAHRPFRGRELDSRHRSSGSRSSAASEATGEEIALDRADLPAVTPATMWPSMRRRAREDRAGTLRSSSRARSGGRVVSRFPREVPPAGPAASRRPRLTEHFDLVAGGVSWSPRSRSSPIRSSSVRSRAAAIDEGDPRRRGARDGDDILRALERGMPPAAARHRHRPPVARPHRRPEPARPRHVPGASTGVTSSPWTRPTSRDACGRCRSSSVPDAELEQFAVRMKEVVRSRRRGRGAGTAGRRVRPRGRGNGRRRERRCEGGGRGPGGYFGEIGRCMGAPARRPSRLHRPEDVVARRLGLQVTARQPRGHERPASRTLRDRPAAAARAPADRRRVSDRGLLQRHDSPSIRCLSPGAAGARRERLALHALVGFAVRSPPAVPPGPRWVRSMASIPKRSGIDRSMTITSGSSCAPLARGEPAAASPATSMPRSC